MKVIKIEYFNNEETEEESTFELFDNIEKAFNFTEFEGIKIISIEIVEVNKGNLYYEENGDLNYEDTGSLFDKELIDLENLSKETEKESLDNKCKYCGKPNNSKDEDVLCEECKETFGHSFYSEL